MDCCGENLFILWYLEDDERWIIGLFHNLIPLYLWRFKSYYLHFNILHFVDMQIQWETWFCFLFVKLERVTQLNGSWWRIHNNNEEIMCHVVQLHDNQYVATLELVVGCVGTNYENMWRRWNQFWRKLEFIPCKCIRLEIRRPLEFKNLTSCKKRLKL